MKAFVILATGLALTALPPSVALVAGTALAQEAQPQPVPETATPETAAPAEVPTGAGAAIGEANEAASDALSASGDAARAATEAAGAKAGEVAEKAARAAREAEAAAAAAVDEALDQAAHIAKPATSEAPAPEAESEVAPVVAAPDVGPPAISPEEPGVLGSWITSRRIWTTNEPASTPWDDSALDGALTARPATWQEIAKVDDVVLDDDGQLVGYIADIGGFLGIGAKKVLLGTQAIHLIRIGEERFYATNFTKAELEALPDFNPATVLK